jgi:membrane-associated phospholipid phosphatase
MLGLGAGGIAGFLVVAVLAANGWTMAIDRSALDAVAALHGGALDPLMIAVTDLGNANVLGALTILAAGGVWVRGSGLAAVFLALGYVLSGLASDGLKAIVERPRPPTSYQIAELPVQTDRVIWAVVAIAVAVVLWRSRWRWPAVAGAAFMVLSIWFDAASVATPGLDSFPSGHAMRSIVLAGSVLVVGPLGRARASTLAIVALVLAIGISRVYLGHHHPTDVVAGWLAGIALVAALSLLPPFAPAIARRDSGGQPGQGSTSAEP